MDHRYNDILKSLALSHVVIISKRHLIRLLKIHGLKCMSYADLWEVTAFISPHTEGPGRLNGYRLCNDVDRGAGTKFFIIISSKIKKKPWWGVLREEEMEYWIELQQSFILAHTMGAVTGQNT